MAPRGVLWAKDNHKLQKTPALKSPGVFLQLQVVICLTLRQLNGKNGSAHEVQNTWR
ncbi:hypothetical protein THOB06_200030 [Vibrio rotiferianus]|nr:hypothetical protein THOE12_150030 [Vibrio rotiferianus]CAH1572883.1 hypothetical protein THOG10_200072 [Vibrio rotiferianus]CAH1574414.1 hypothetical protein THOB06_200030 [Vibrio rotiferianus]